MTTDPTKLVDSEGEELSLNKVDKALKSIGISLQDTNGQFRNFDDVILELASKWDTLDTNAQRYIATVMAGNRQQSRFLAMVGNYERLAELTEEAANSEDAALIQQLKTMDSLQAKMNQLKVTFQEFYTSTGIEDLIKWTVDGITNIISRLNDMPKVFGKLPIAALATVVKIISGIKAGGNALGPQVVKWFTDIKSKVQPIGLDLGKEYGEQIAKGIESKQQRIQNATENALRGNSSTAQQAAEGVGKYVSRRSIREQATFGGKFKNFVSKGLSIADIFGTVISGIGMITPPNWEHIFGVDSLGQAVSGIGSTLSGFARIAAGDYIGGIASLISGIPNLIDGIVEDTEEKIDRLSKTVEETSNQALLSKNELKTLTDYKKKYEELSKEQYTSVEAKQEFLNLQNEIAEKYPELISGMTTEGTYLVDLGKKYEALYQEKKRVYDLDALSAQAAQLSFLSDDDAQLKDYAEKVLPEAEKDNNWTGWIRYLSLGFAEGAEEAQIQEGVRRNLASVFSTFQDTKFLQDELKTEDFWKSVSENMPYGVAKTFTSQQDYENFKQKQSSFVNAAPNSSLSKNYEYYWSGIDYLVNASDYFAQKYNASLKQTANTLLQIELPEETKIDDYQFLFDQASERIGKEWLQYLSSLEEGTDIETALKDFSQDKVPQIVADFSKEIENIDTSDYNKELKKINEIYSNPELYSLPFLENFTEDAGEYLTDQQKTDLLAKAEEQLTEAQTSLSAIFENAFTEGLIDESTWGNLGEALIHLLRFSSQNLYENYLNQYSKILNSQNLSQQGKLGLTQDIHNLLKTFRLSFSEEEYAQIEQIVSSADFLSYQGIFDLENQLEGLSFLKESNFDFNTEPFINRIIPNLVTESQTLTDNLASSLEGFEEALQKATSGMSFEEAKAMAEHLGISLKDFREQGGEFFLDNAILVEDYLTKNEETFSALKNKIETLEKHLTPEFDILEQLTNDTKFSEQDGLEEQAAYIQNLYGWLGIEEEEAIQYAQLFNQHYEEYVEAVANGTTEGQFGDYVRKELEDLTEEYKIASKASRSAILNTLLTLGDFNQFLSLLSLETFEGEVVLSKADRALIESGDFLNLSESGKAIFAPFIEQYSSSLQETRQEIIQQIQEKIFSENQDFITATQANKKVLSSLASSGVLAEYSTDEEGNITYKVVENISESLWASALSAAGATTKEINELLVDFYENKNNEVDSSVAKHSALSDVIENIDNLTPEILESVANILNITIDEVISTYGLQANEDGTYDASQNFIQSLLSQFKIGVTSEIEDSLNDYLNNIISIASSGIEGSATNTEIETLQNYLNEQGQDIELKTFKTAEGLKLTEDSVYEIYYALSQIDAIAAQSLLEGISEQMEEWEGRGVDIATIYGKIGEAQKKIEDLEKDPDDSRLRLAKAELATLQQIAKEKSKDEDNFDFMNKDLGDLNNPITFYDSSAKAFEAIGEAASTGYMDIEAYVNMINFAADMYAKAGQNFELNGLSASEAIRAGFAAIEGVDGEAKINMSGLTFGTEELTEGMEFGIEEMARSQIEWIDAQIAMLRGFETLENLDMADSKNQNAMLDYIDNYIGDFTLTIDGTTKKLSEALAEFTPEQLTEFFTGIQNILKTYDPSEYATKLAQFYRDFFTKYGKEIEEITTNDSEYTRLKETLAENIASLADIDWINDYLTEDVHSEDFDRLIDSILESLGIENPAEIKKAILERLEQDEDGKITGDELLRALVETGEFEVGDNGEIQYTGTAKIEFGKVDPPDGKPDTKNTYETPNGDNNLDKPDGTADVGTLTITAEKAVLGREDGETKEGGFDTIVPEGIAETTTAIETGLTPAISSMGTTAEDARGKLEKARIELGRIRSVAGNLSSSKIQKFADAVNSLNNGGTKLGILGSIVEQINKLPTSPRYVGTASASGNVTTPPSSSLNNSNSWDLNGNGIVDTLEEWQLKESMAKGNALAAGTLMGELGPELVVSGGRYYVVGQNGAEFVNLPSDAIVFNHLQTKRLLESGHINSTGDPVTNERNAVAWATGNVNGGPAMASASDVIAQLLELRAFWQGILEMSAQDFAKVGGGGKGGGGGGGEDNKAYVADLERWYNLLRQIANLEQKITLEQAKRQNMLNGYDYVDSLENELDQLKRQEKAYRDLSALQKSYYDTRRQDLLNSDYSKIFTYTSDGLMQYHEGENIGFDILAKLQETDTNGQMKMNATEQLAYLESIGFDTSVLKVTKEGEDVDSETEMVQNFFDNVQAWMDELDGLYDSYNEALINVEEAIAAQNAIQQEYIDNQLSLEQQVLTAIIDREQAAIDAAQDEIDAIQEASDDFINGLNDTLKREKDMYQTNNEQAETERLQRQLAILQRSGGSASEIRALEEQLESRYQDAYFDSMQDEIDAIQTASEKQIEKLQEQVDIAVEALEYQKANGLLWNEVYEIMNNWDANAITQFVMEFTKAFKEQSTLQNQEQAKETQMSAEKWDAAAERQKQTEMWDQYFRQAMEQYGQTAATNAYSSAKAAYDRAYQATEGTVEQKHAAGMAAAKIEFEKSKAEIDRVTSGVSNGGGNSSGETYPYGKVSEISRKETNVLKHEGPAIATIKYALKKLGYYKGEINEKYGTEVYNALVAFQKANKIDPDGIVGEETKKAFKLKGYSLGGLVDYTGLAMVHGTPQKPESYLNAEQTQELRNLLDEARTLNSVSHSISNLNRLRQVWQTELFNQISSKEQSHQDVGDLIFEDVDINITSGVINNQAEAAQLGRTMWNEFINVAKKTGNLTLSRR